MADGWLSCTVLLPLERFCCFRSLEPGPAEGARRDPDQAMEMTREVALVGKPDPDRDLRQRGLGADEHLSRPIDPPLEDVAVGRQSDRISEGSREVRHGQARGVCQGLEPEVLIEMRVDVLADATHDHGRQATSEALRLRDRRRGKQARAGPHVELSVSRASPRPRVGGRRDERLPGPGRIEAHQRERDVTSIATTEDGGRPFEEAPKRYAIR